MTEFGLSFKKEFYENFDLVNTGKIQKGKWKIMFKPKD
jgi:hypothetical protein